MLSVSLLLKCLREPNAVSSPLWFVPVAAALTPDTRHPLIFGTGLILQGALSTSGGGWSSVPKGGVENVWACLKEVDSLETDHDGRVRARPGRRGELLRVAAALGVLRGYLLPWKRLPVVLEALRVSEDLSVWYARAPLELTVWFVADGLFWALTLASPAVSYAIGWLDWLAKGRSESFRGMLVALLALVILYFAMSLFIEAVFLTAGILYRGSNILFRRFFWKQKVS